MRMQLVDSAPDPRVQGLDELPGKVNYFRGNDSSKWRANVRTYKRVRYTSVYPGVDLIYYGQPQQLEYDFIVAPGADPSAIKLAFAGVEDTTVDARGDLVLETAGGPLRFHRPLVYQMQEGRRRTIKGSYVQRSAHEVGFRVASYDRTRPLIIDPVLSYATYLGGTSGDIGAEIGVDATGAIFVAGNTNSDDFPTVNALQPARSGAGGFESEMFVAKLTPDGAALIYATYLGGSGREQGPGFAVDAAGNAYITGSTSSPDFPTVRPLQDTLNGVVDAFVAKLSADGSQLIYSTYLGGRNGDGSSAIAVDLTGAAYITGATNSPDFPTANGLPPECMGDLGEAGDAFVAKLTPDGTALAYSTHFGGNSNDTGRDIAVDSLGAAYVAGVTDSANFPTGNPVHPFRGSRDAFVAKLAADGRSLTYSTPLGGSAFDEATDIAVDMSGAASVTGQTDSFDFPTVNALQPVRGALTESFVAKLPPEGGALVYATYLGGSQDDITTSIAVDSAGAAHVTGNTTSADFPIMNPLQPELVAGTTDAFVTKLAPDGATLVHSTYLGGNGSDSSEAITVDLAGTVYITGFTDSTDFPTVQPLQPTVIGGVDAFIAKITGDGLTAAAGNDNIDGSQSGDGGGSIDALLAVLLAQLTLARALRQRSRLRH
jgi:hypothetical protein